MSTHEPCMMIHSYLSLLWDRTRHRPKAHRNTDFDHDVIQVENEIGLALSIKLIPTDVGELTVPVSIDTLSFTSIVPVV